MNEGPPNSFGESPEPIPTAEEVEVIFRELFGEKEYSTVRKLGDEDGVYIWDIVLPGEDDTKYSYARKGQFPEGNPQATAIHVSFFDEKGSPIGGHSVAKYIDGKWKLTP